MAKKQTKAKENIVKSTQLVKSIRIQNFRCFEDITITFEVFNSIVGENGSGKTSILEALYMALSPSTSSSRFDEQDFNNLDKDNIEIEVFFTEEFTANLRDGWATQKILCNGIYLLVKRRDRSAPNQAFSDEFVMTHHVIPTTIKPDDSGRYSLSRVSTEKPFLFTERDLSFPLDLDNFPRTFYFAKNRENQIKTGFNSTFEKVTKEFNWRFRKELESFKEEYVSKWLEIQEMINRSLSKSKIDKAIEEIKVKLKTLLGRDFDNLEVSIFNLENPFAKSFFSLRDGLNQVEHDGVGSGISMILTYSLLETVSVLAKEKILILIDEPELHLHPQLQEKLFQHLQMSEAQIIISTHSEHMIDISNWESIKRISSNNQCFPSDFALETELEHRGSKKTMRSHLDDIKKYHQDKMIFYKENNKLLFAQKCILVEGQAEQYGLIIIGKQLNSDINHLTIINCNGKTKIPNYQLLCKVFGIPYYTIFDLDSEAANTVENKSVIDWSDKYFHFASSFEDLYGTSGSKHKGSKTIDAILDSSAIPKEVQDLFEDIKTNFIG